MSVGGPASLHLDPHSVGNDTHNVGRGHHYVTDELLQPVIKVASGQQNIVTDQLVIGLVNILLDELFDWLPVALFSSGLSLHLKDSIDRLALEVDRVAVLHQYTDKDCIPSEVGTAQCEEELKGSEVVQSCQHFILQLFHVIRAVGNVGCHLEGILQLVRGLSVNH